MGSGSGGDLGGWGDTFVAWQAADKGIRGREEGVEVQAHQHAGLAVGPVPHTLLDQPCCVLMARSDLRQHCSESDYSDFPLPFPHPTPRGWWVKAQADIQVLEAAWFRPHI